MKRLSSIAARAALALALAAPLLAPHAAVAAEQDLDIPNTTFFGATAFTRFVAGSPVRKGYLFSSSPVAAWIQLFKWVTSSWSIKSHQDYRPWSAESAPFKQATLFCSIHQKHSSVS